MLNSEFNNMYILRNYLENIVFLRVLTSQGRAERVRAEFNPNTLKARLDSFSNEHIYVFELEFEFLTNRVFIESNSNLFANSSVREQL